MTTRPGLLGMPLAQPTFPWSLLCLSAFGCSWAPSLSPRRRLGGKHWGDCLHCPIELLNDSLRGAPLRVTWEMSDTDKEGTLIWGPWLEVLGDKEEQD